MNHAITARQPAARASLRAVYQTLGYEVIPHKQAEETVLAHIPRRCG